MFTHHTGNRLVILLLSGVVLTALPGKALGITSLTFSSTGTEQTFTVPAGVTSVRIVAIGGQGGGSSFSGTGGGYGAQVDAGDVSVTPGQTLYIEVGGNGGVGTSSGTGGYNGGGNGSLGGGGGGGGGATDVRTISQASSGSLESRLVVAAGGGGGGAYSGGAGGNAGSAGANGSGGPIGGGVGTLTAGGAGGAGNSSDNGTSGVLATGGSGGGGGFYGGGGGGGGFYGGGGGGGNNSATAAAGGGGGSSYATGSTASATLNTAGVPLVSISYREGPTASAQTQSLSFTTQAQSTASAPQLVTITNTSIESPLVVSGFSFAGANSGDFLLDSTTCLGPVSPGSSCQIGIRFAPQAQGARSATLQVTSNDPNSPASITLTGTGGQLPQGPSGTNGQVELVTCKPTTQIMIKKINGKRKRIKVTRRICTSKMVSSPVKFRTSSVTRVTLSQSHSTHRTRKALRHRSKARWFRSRRSVSSRLSLDARSARSENPAKRGKNQRRRKR